MNVEEQAYGKDAILVVLRYPDGQALYRPFTPWGSPGWHTTPEEAAQAGLGIWRFELQYYRRDCQGRRRALQQVERLEAMLKEAPAERGST